MTRPPEPPQFAVVIDTQRRVWQRRGDTWQAAGSAYRKRWGRLNHENGPLTHMVASHTEPQRPKVS